MNAYDYAPLYRPPGFATLPPGWDLIARGMKHQLPARGDLPLSDKPFGVVRYRRPLSKSELETYELEPA